MSDDLTLEKLKIVEQLQSIAQNQAIMKEQINGFKTIHDNVNKILDRHDLILLGDGSLVHIGMSARMKALEDDLSTRSTHAGWMWTAIAAEFIEHIRHLFFGAKP